MLSKQQSPHFLPESENMTMEQIRKQSCFSFAMPPPLAPSLNHFSIFFSFFCSFLLRFPGSVGVERKDGGGGRTADGENLEKIVLAFFAKLTSLLTQTGFKDVKH